MNISSCKSFITSITLLCFAFLPLALKAEEKGMQLSKSDKSFIAEAYRGGLSEIKVGELAKSKAATPDAKALAERLVSDHQKANEELKTLAESKGIKVPTEPNAASQALYKTLEKKQGADFDKMFAEDAVKDHNKDISHFEKIAKETKDADLKNFVERTVPVLKEHLALAKTAAGNKE